MCDPRASRRGAEHETHWACARFSRAVHVAKPAGVKVVFDVADPFAVERYRGDFLELIREHVEIGVLKT